MSESTEAGGQYLAWDGRHYEGQPPEGWYLAADNRWWPPGHEPSAPAPAAAPTADVDSAAGAPTAGAPTTSEQGGLGRLRSRAERAAKQVRESERVQSAAESARRVRESERVQSAAESARRVRESERAQAAAGSLQSAAQAAADSAQRVAKSERAQDLAQTASDSAQTAAKAVQSAAGTAAGSVQQAAQSDRVQAVTASAGRMTTSVRERDVLGDIRRLAASAARRLGILRGHANPPPAMAVVGAVLAAGFAALLTFPAWVTVDVSNTTDALPDFVPSTLVDTALFGYSTHDLLGTGFALAGVVIAAGLTMAFGAVRRASLWMVVSAVVFLVCAIGGGTAVALLVTVESAYEWILPDNWEPYSPEVIVELAGFVFTGVNTALAGLTLWLWHRMRPGWREARQAELGPVDPEQSSDISAAVAAVAAGNTAEW